ncbi:M23 family peptidase [Leptolyngbyaceae cyanobacterium CCMR0082]|uniref:M23 family peptidase n=1 Tax=Adonisia turfae CCMR0082 TaxID=2304604 RepID=A0A6M0SCS3_9CYAN|nr:M23 family metallopeptidase [Adonisia turfae]NEZ66274.1 M23 family peptidase [Adonisia turfae CCMR0082]
MTASDKTFIQLVQNLPLQSSQLLRVSTFAVVGLLSTQAVLAQAEMGAASDLATPQSAVETPQGQVAPPVAPAPLVVEPVAPSSVVPSSIEAPSSGAVDYGTVFIEPAPAAAPTLESLRTGRQAEVSNGAPDVEVISPADYGAGLIDTTSYSVGATMPDVVISERSSGCEFLLEGRNGVSNAACGTVGRLAGAIANRLTPGQAQGGFAGSAINIPGLPLPGGTTAAARDYYNRAAQAVVQLQLGEKFIFPLTVPASISSLFGWRMHPIFGVQRFHSGTDIAAPMGTSVVATQSGRVTVSEYLGGYGLTVILRHNDNSLESRYAHLAQILVQPGEWVEQGEVIGLVGSTGNSTGPHLHFELRQLTSNGWVVLNPDSLVKQTLGTLAQALGNSSLLTFSGASTLQPISGEAVADLPFRPAQPLAN